MTNLQKIQQETHREVIESFNDVPNLVAHKPFLNEYVIPFIHSRESIAYKAGLEEVMKKISALRIPTYYGEPYGAGDKIVNDAIDKALEIVKEVMK